MCGVVHDFQYCLMIYNIMIILSDIMVFYYYLFFNKIKRHFGICADNLAIRFVTKNRNRLEMY